MFAVGVRQGRMKAPGSPAYAFYHCMSRIVDRQFLLEEPERDQFEKFMDEYARFCGLTVITHNVMSNHFHLLLLVPKAPETPLTDEELLSRIEALSGSPGSRTTRQQLELFRQREQHEAAEALRQRFLVRMWDLSSFMKSLKQRFSQWYNQTHGRVGTLWEGRFKSVLVQSEGEAVAAMAAYIDLNSFRAGLTDDPATYRWCGYARACRGDIAAQESVRRVIAGAQRVSPESLTLQQALDQYRSWLMVQGEQNEGIDAQGRPLRRGFSPEAVLEVLRGKGRVALNDYVRLRVRYFVDGLVMGSRAYVNEVFEKARHRFGPKRKDGARRMRGVESKDLYVLRDLKRDPISRPAVLGPIDAARGGRGPPRG